ncbi:MAG: cob(I)yrinic acid a,c-diamide adenosyltransferase [Bacteroidia bacterium]
MKIYTKTGDQGLTSLIGGVRVSKAHLRIESYGTVDELNSWIGLLRARQSNTAMDALLNDIQNQLFVIGSHLAADPEKSRMSLPEWELSYTEKLEQSIDEMMQTLPELRNFVLPGGNEAAATAHIARCVCRRAERLVVALQDREAVELSLVVYLNRLSDFLFTLARKLCVDAGNEEFLWQPARKK